MKRVKFNKKRFLKIFISCFIFCLMFFSFSCFVKADNSFSGVGFSAKELENINAINAKTPATKAAVNNSTWQSIKDMAAQAWDWGNADYASSPGFSEESDFNEHGFNGIDRTDGAR